MRAQVDIGKEIPTEQLYQQFKLEVIDSECDTDHENCDNSLFSKYVLSIFPNVKIKRRNKDQKQIKLFHGISLKTENADLNNISHLPINLIELKEVIPTSCSTVKINNQDLICEIDTNYLSNGHDVKKTITFLGNSHWKLEIAKKCIDLESLRISDTYKCTHESVSLVFETVQKLSVCQGITVKQSITCSRYHVLENWTDVTEKKDTRKIRSLLCLRAVSFISLSDGCRMCKKMTFGQVQERTEKSKENPSMETTYTQHAKGKNVINVSKEDFRKLIPTAPDEMLELLLSQSNNCGRDPKGRRWNKIILSTCLQLYNRTPYGYISLRNSRLLVLPSPSLLVLYKNSVHQKVGFQKKMFEWMHQEAKRLEIPKEGWIGGVIIDEMAIQEDLQIMKNGDAVELEGFVDLGPEGNTCKTLRTGKNEKQLGNHVLQFVFVGLSGFRFPFAHFLSNQVQATELHTLFWESIDNLQMYGFDVVFTCMDGASSNRSFLHINIGLEDTFDKSMSVPNPCDMDETVIFMMDYSHCMKKIRNNLLKSGIQKGCTRHLTLPNNDIIQWQMWVDCYHWDQQNALQIHRHLTNEHIFPPQQSKMRNHLAEGVLNDDMLNLFQIYQSALGGKGAVLNGVIQLLQNTSKMISIFRDIRPITNVDDDRLKQLQEVQSWFVEWKNGIKSSSMSNKEKDSCLMSYQCLEDLSSCIMGFIELCVKVVGLKNEHVSIVPALINSDVIENEFNQQRSTYNGANTNPNSVQYRKSLNSIILGQSAISKKANAGKCKTCTVPYTFENPCPLRQKRKTEGNLHKLVKKIKVIRF